ncbi:MAG: MoaD/ThiS family protein [SAR202 cluster bacterium]|nr:MoaD/ThiS family protein [SAR202 cluster bacterium]MQG85406.1 MoaD/ThiS family protein [SAR202 cluster bacterium]|tara:strand:+ start:146 stop:424 length:279 start_codon:yes stop_codon:yes gene_type:complete
MGIKVRIPGPLRKLTNELDQVEITAGNIGELIDLLEKEYNGMKERLCDEDGELRYFVNIYLNGEDIRFIEGMNTPTESGDEVSIVPAVAGGE